MEAFRIFSSSIKQAIFKRSLSTSVASANKENRYVPIETTLRKTGYISSHETYTDFLLKNKMIDFDETPQTMFQRVARTLADAGNGFYNQTRANQLYSTFLDQLTSFKLILSTPLYTNAGRHLDKPLSACVVPPISKLADTRDNYLKLISTYHIAGMGTGFNFNESEDPVTDLKELNEHAASEVHRGLIERPVGNMGILSVDHPGYPLQTHQFGTKPALGLFMWASDFILIKSANEVIL